MSVAKIYIKFRQFIDLFLFNIKFIDFDFKLMSGINNYDPDEKVKKLYL